MPVTKKAAPALRSGDNLKYMKKHANNITLL